MACVKAKKILEARIVEVDNIDTDSARLKMIKDDHNYAMSGDKLMASSETQSNVNDKDNKHIILKDGGMINKIESVTDVTKGNMKAEYPRINVKRCSAQL